MTTNEKEKIDLSQLEDTARIQFDQFPKGQGKYLVYERIGMLPFEEMHQRLRDSKGIGQLQVGSNNGPRKIIEIIDNSIGYIEFLMSLVIDWNFTNKNDEPILLPKDQEGSWKALPTIYTGYIVKQMEADPLAGDFLLS